MRPPPRYRYPLYEEWDWETYQRVVKLARVRPSPRVKGDRNRLLRNLMASQLADDWRTPLESILTEMEKGEVEELEKPRLGQRPAWVIFREEEEIWEFYSRLPDRAVRFSGSSEALGEFLLRFVLAQLLLDWRGSLFALMETIGESPEVALGKLNRVLAEFDYTGVFGRKTSVGKF